MSYDSQQESPWSSPLKCSFTRCLLFVAVLLSAASAVDAGEYVYFADDEAPVDTAPPEVPLCYKFKAAGLEEQLGKLRKKYADKIYDAKIVKNTDGSHSLTAKRREKQNKIMELNNDGQKDFVIQLVGSTDGCILGAHSTLFWIFVHTSKGYKLVFKKTGQWLNVSKKETNGYKNISISTAVGWATMIGIDYRYNENQYLSYRCFSYSIDESSDDHSVRYEKCSIKSIE